MEKNLNNQSTFSDKLRGIWDRLTPYLRYIGKRLLVTIPVIIIISMVIYTLIYIMPGDPILAMLDPEKTKFMTPEQKTMYIENMRVFLGYDKGFVGRYFVWWEDILTGNFGYSIRAGLPVHEFLGDYIGRSFRVNIAGFIVAFLIAIPVGISAAVNKGKVFDKSVTVFSMIGISLPSFFIALILILIFAAYLKVLPFSGMSDPRGIRPDFMYMILPVTVIVLGSLASLVRYIRASMLNVLKMDYIRTARSKGLSEKIVIYRHAFSNALIPVVTIIGNWIPALFGGSIIVETIFAWPGIGYLMNQSYSFKDYAVLQTVLLFFGVLTMAGNLFIDIGYAIVDPRIREGNLE